MNDRDNEAGAYQQPRATSPPQASAATVRTGRRKRSSTTIKANRVVLEDSNLSEPSGSGRTPSSSEPPSEPEPEPRVVFELPPKPKSGPPHPMCPRSDKWSVERSLVKASMLIVCVAVQTYR